MTPENAPARPDAASAVLSRREAIRRTAALLGIALTPAWLDGIARAQTAGGGAAAASLTKEQLATVAAIAERILPRTDTPGAGDVGVAAFIDLIVGGYLTDVERATFLAGLGDMEARSQRAHRRNFPALGPAEQDALLRQVAAESQAKEKTFFHLVKDLTLIGYFTSEPVGRSVTHFDPIPGRYDACLPLSEVGNRAWTR